MGDPFYTFFLGLIDRVVDSPSGFNGLSEPEKLCYAVALVRDEVYNGGFHQYFFNSSGSYYNYAENGLVRLGATQILELLRLAKEIVFPLTPVPMDMKTRRLLIPIPGYPLPDWAEKLNEIDRRFNACPDEITPRLEAYAREHKLVPPKKDASE